MLKKNIKEALTDFLKSEEGEALIGNIVMKAVSQSMLRKVMIEDGTTDPPHVVEKEITINALDHLMKYVPRIEGAIRGCQSDSAQARNRSADVLRIIEAIANTKQIGDNNGDIHKIQ